jgi:hypothetical protein
VKSASVFVDGRRLRRPRLLEFRQVATGQDCQEAMPHGALKRGRAISGTDVTHFFGLTLKVGQRRPDYRGVSVREISNGTPGWIENMAINRVGRGRANGFFHEF